MNNVYNVTLITLIDFQEILHAISKNVEMVSLIQMRSVMMEILSQVTGAQNYVPSSWMGTIANLRLLSMVQYVKNVQKIVKDAQDQHMIIVHSA